MTPIVNVSNVKIQQPIRTNRVSIYESPIFTVTKDNIQIHIILNTGATASLITLAKAKELRSSINPTTHKAVQVDGVSDLKVLGEVHTHFYRGQIQLQFSGLVVNHLGTDVLGGTNFHTENDIYCRMSQGSIVVKGNNIFQMTPPEVMKMSKPKSRLVKVKRTQTVMPGDSIQLQIPIECEKNGTFIVEPRYDQGDVQCDSQIVTAVNDLIDIEVKAVNMNAPVKLKKNSTPIQILESPEVIEDNCIKPKDFTERFKSNQQNKTLTEKLKEVNLDQAKSMSENQKELFRKTLLKFKDVLGDDLPGYNNFFGVVKASIKFASRARPTPHKTRLPSYGEHGQRLFNMKALSMVKKGVLVDPYELGIQPTIINNSWVVKKQSAAHKKWEDCTEQDVRMVTGFDPINKFLSQTPSKATNPMMIYSSISNWTYMAELDFRDMYWQIKFNLDSMSDRKQLQFLCIRTIGGTLAYARGPNGLLGMDSYCEELTDKVLGDLI